MSVDADLFRNLETDRIKELFDKEGVSQIDYIFASDVIFNIKHLEIVPKVRVQLSIILYMLKIGHQKHHSRPEDEK